MAISNSVSLNVNGNHTATTYSNTGQVRLDTGIDDGEADELHIISIDVSEMLLLYMVSDQDLSIETNSSSSPGDTITLTANVPYLWRDDNATCGSGAGGADSVTKLSVDVTALYLTNASGSNATFKLECIYDDFTP